MAESCNHDHVDNENRASCGLKCELPEGHCQQCPPSVHQCSAGHTWSCPILITPDMAAGDEEGT